jgi:hypothetical protein
METGFGFWGSPWLLRFWLALVILAVLLGISLLVGWLRGWR